MKIYGKTLGTIWNEMLLPYRIVVAVGTAFLFFSVIYLLVNLGGGVSNALKNEAGPVQIFNASATNFLDPTLASDGKTVTALAYTGTETTAAGTAAPLRISIATSTFPCGPFRHAADVFTERPEGLTAPDGHTEMAQGAVRYETPSLVFDPSDAAAPWKIFAYRYFWMGSIPYAQRYSMIVMRTAAAPTGPWGREVWLLASAPDYPPPPYQNLVSGFINPMSTELARVSGYTRPSVVAYRGALLMSLVALTAAGDMDRVILLASVDQGKNWGYTGTLLTRAQAAALPGTTRIAGASLIQRSGTVYLAAVLGNDTVSATGTTLIPILDPSKAQIAMTAAGAPAVVMQLPRQSEQPTDFGGGYAAYEPTCPAGIITSEHSGLRGSYQLFRTLKHPPSVRKE